MIDKMTTEKIIGCFESVSFPELAIYNTVAKIDTGAFSGALHCTNIRVVKRGADKKRILKFNPLDDPTLAYETDKFDAKYVRSSTGHRLRRYVITTKMTICDEEYELKIGLSDRTDMKREVLVGRRFLRENGILVDVRKHSELDDEGESTQ
jgi:hypothetical protein